MSDWLELMNQKRFEEAVEQVEAEFAAGSNDTEHILVRAGFYENWGDWLSEKDPGEARRLYARSLADYQRFASWSTAAAEGHLRMMDVDRVTEKLAGVGGKPVNGA